MPFWWRMQWKLRMGLYSCKECNQSFVLPLWTQGTICTHLERFMHQWIFFISQLANSLKDLNKSILLTDPFIGAAMWLSSLRVSRAAKLALPLNWDKWAPIGSEWVFWGPKPNNLLGARGLSPWLTLQGPLNSRGSKQLPALPVLSRGPWGPLWCLFHFSH